MKSLIVSVVSIAATLAALYAFMYFNPWVKLIDTADMNMIVAQYNARVLDLMMCRAGGADKRSGNYL